MNDSNEDENGDKDCYNLFCVCNKVSIREIVYAIVNNHYLKWGDKCKLCVPLVKKCLKEQENKK